VIDSAFILGVNDELDGPMLLLVVSSEVVGSLLGKLCIDGNIVISIVGKFDEVRLEVSIVGVLEL